MAARFIVVALIALACEGGRTERPSQPTPAAPGESARPAPTPPLDTRSPQPSARPTPWLDAEAVTVPPIGSKDSLARREGECLFAAAVSCPPGTVCNATAPKRVDCRTPPPAGKEGWFRFPARLVRESETLCRYEAEAWCPPPRLSGACAPSFRVRLPCDREARFRWSGSCFVLDAHACAQPPCEGNAPRKTACPG